MTLPTADTWALDSRLAADTVFIGDLPLCRLLLIKDANYPWLVLVPRRKGASEIIDLSAEDRALLIDEIARVSSALKQRTGCDKLNVAALGNMVPQLHIHIIARRQGDAAWPKPVWGAVPPATYAEEEIDDAVAVLKHAIGLN